MQLEEILKGLGLTEGEAKIYLKLISLGEATASELGRLTKIQRRNAYDITKRLMEKGLISSIQKDRQTMYLPVEPLKLSDILNEREEKLLRLREEFSKALPVLQEAVRKREPQVGAKLLFGKEGVKAVYLDELEVGKTVSLICTDIGVTEEMLKYFLPRYDRQRVRLKVGLKIIALEKHRRELKKYPLAEIRFLPDEFFSPAGLSVYGDRVSIILWSDEPIVVLIKNEEIAKNFKNYFKLMWGIAKE
jgi:sugar-specific transcriptional regulator TrmB